MRVPRGSGLLLLSALLAVAVPVLLARASIALAVPAGVSVWRWGMGLALCGLCYLLSHMARATRLAMISGKMLGVSLRTAALVHLFVAPWSIILPFKLDEILRWRELSRISGHLWRALIACLIDRTADGLVLLGLLLAFTSHNDINQVGGVMVVLLTLAIGASMVCFILVPSMLELIQQYLFEHHFGARSLTMITWAHHVRIELSRGRDTITHALPWLLVCTIIAWLLELAATLVLLGIGFGQTLAFQPAVLLLLQRASRTANILGGMGHWGGAAPGLTLSVVYLAVLSLAWIAVARVYLRRWRGEPRRRPAAERPLFATPATQEYR